MINSYLQYIQESKKPDILYHAADRYKKTLKPRKSTIGHTGRMKGSYPTKKWELNAVYAGTTPEMCYPFGFERVNMMWPGNHTEEEVSKWTKASYLSASAGNGRLVMCYYNYTPTKPIYLYTVDSKYFTLVKDKLGAIVEQWYCKKEIPYLKVEKILPNQIKQSWKKIGQKDWEIKKRKYKEKGYYK